MFKQNRRHVFLPLLCILLLAGVLWEPYELYRVRSGFVDNGRNEQYAQGIALCEMNLRRFDYYFIEAVALIAYNCERVVVLPADLSYYAAPDGAEPVLTLPKGTRVTVWPEDSAVFPPGYGCVCYPDYQRGWRYGNPFLLESEPVDSLEAPPNYYVRTRDLEGVADAFFRINPRLRLSSDSLFGKGERYHLVRKMDKILYQRGVFCSPDLIERP